MNTEMVKQSDNQQLETVSELPTVRPPVDIYENADEFLVVADLPAVSRDDLQIHLDAERLTIEGKVRQDIASDAVEREFRLMSYRRSFELPDAIDRDKVAAQFEHGVLHLHLPKTEAVKPRRIEVHAG